MAQGGGVPGIAVGMAGAAALLIYAGFKGTNPIDALRDVATGRPKGLADRAALHQTLYEGLGAPDGSSGGSGSSGGVAQASLSTTAVSGPHPELVTAAGHHAMDQYSQLRRWDPGYSDCSSFVGKAFKDCGISPPGGSTTTSYLTWRALAPISRDQVGAGDLLVSSGHMAIAINNTTAIGQQNERVNVEVGPISQLMWGQSWVALRYTGSTKGSAST